MKTMVKFIPIFLLVFTLNSHQPCLGMQRILKALPLPLKALLPLPLYPSENIIIHHVFGGTKITLNDLQNSFIDHTNHENHRHVLALIIATKNYYDLHEDPMAYAPILRVNIRPEQNLQGPFIWGGYFKNLTDDDLLQIINLNYRYARCCIPLPSQNKTTVISDVIHKTTVIVDCIIIGDDKGTLDKIFDFKKHHELDGDVEMLD